MSIKLKYFRSLDAEQNEKEFNEFMKKYEIGKADIIKIYSTALPYTNDTYYIITLVYVDVREWIKN